MKTRLLGAAVLVALLVLFVPMFFPSSPPTTAGDQSVSLAIPPAPDRDLQTRTMSLNPDAAPAAASSGAVVIPASGSDGLATVDIASRRPTDVGTDAAAPSRNTASTDAPSGDTASVPAGQDASEPVIKQQTPSAPPPARPAPGAAATPAETATHGNYRLNLSAYASASGAQSLMQRVRALGYPANSHTLHQGGKTLTAVEAGPFDTRTAAESARLKISQSISGVPVRIESGASNSHGDDTAASAPKAPAAGSAGKRAAGAASKAGGWAVQVAAVSGQADANALRDKLRANGFDGFVDSVTVGGRKLWRVRAGPQTQRDDAVRVRDQIKSRLGMAGNIVSVP